MSAQYTPKDYKNQLRVKWCPGCGDFGALNSVHKAMADLNLNPENITVVSGIGCSSRFTYYMNTYGFHTIHGRAAAFASGIKITNPRLSVWQVTGDGDALAIGGNHFIHTIRRNMNINILLFNNQIYGLTKGQYSPTSKKGFVSKTSPFGTVEEPFRPGELVIGASGNFFARTTDVDTKLASSLMKASEQHTGTAVVEILQNCVIFNHKTHDLLTNKDTREDHTILLEHGKAMIYGKDKNKGLVWGKKGIETVTIGENGISEQDIMVHDAHEKSNFVHLNLAGMRGPDFPVALGIIRQVETPVYDEAVEQQIQQVQDNTKIRSFKDLAHSGETWEIK